MKVAMFFLMVASCLIAPHLTWAEAKHWALVCIGLAIGFGMLEAML